MFETRQKGLQKLMVELQVQKKEEYSLVSKHIKIQKDFIQDR
jgi:hypothetical protein